MGCSNNPGELWSNRGDMEQQERRADLHNGRPSDPELPTLAFWCIDLDLHTILGNSIDQPCFKVG